MTFEEVVRNVVQKATIVVPTRGVVAVARFNKRLRIVCVPINQDKDFVDTEIVQAQAPEVSQELLTQDLLFFASEEVADTLRGVFYEIQGATDEEIDAELDDDDLALGGRCVECTYMLDQCTAVCVIASLSNDGLQDDIIRKMME